MTYEVYLPGYGTMMHTKSVRCVDDTAKLDILSRDGYKFKVDGKIVAKSNVHQAVADSLGISVKEVKKQIKGQADYSEECAKSAHKINIIEEHTVISSKDAINPEVVPTSKRRVTRIRCVELDTVYKNMTEAGKSLGIDPAYISDAVRLNKPTKGYHFERVEE